MKTNVIYCGDCAKVMVNYIPDNSIDLLYADPPFFSNKQYEVIWGDGYELRSFEDRWKGGIENYIAWMEEKLRECHRVLKQTGSIYLHCDYHASHHLKILMDDIFGLNHFRNEIIWSYKRYTAASNRFQRLHDVILFYSKSKKVIFNDLREEYSSKSGKADSHYKQDGDGRWYRWQKRKGKKAYKVYLSEGKRMGDVWDISIINASAKERLGYPTQKPEALLERIIKSSSNRGNILLDPFCGCGTTLAVAHKLKPKRKWIGIDVSPTACKLMVKRMRKLGVNISKDNIIGLPRTLTEIRKLQPFEFQNWVCEKLLARQSAKKTGDMGIDGWLIDGRPLQVKQSERIGRNVIDNFETAIKRRNKKHGMIVAFSFGKGAIEEVARAKNKEGLYIELKTVKEIIDEI